MKNYSILVCLAITLHIPYIVPKPERGVSLRYAAAVAALQQAAEKQKTKGFCNACASPADLSGVYTAIAECCTATFTLLADIEVEVNSIVAVLSDTPTVFGVAIADLTEFYTALEACCEGTFTAIAAIDQDLSGIFTSLEAVYEGICSPQFIRQSDLDSGITFTISQPGLYLFDTNLTFSPIIGQPAIAINADQVTIDMCGHSLTQISTITNTDGVMIEGTASLPGRSNVTIKNGIIKHFSRAGIIGGVISSGEFITLLQITNIDCIGDGIQSQGAIVLFSSIPMSISNAQIMHCTASGMTNVGIFLFGTQDVTVDACTIDNAARVTAPGQQPDFSGISAFFGLKTNIKNSTVSDCGTTDAPVIFFTGVQIFGSQQCLIDNCFVVDNISSNLNTAFAITQPSVDIQFQNCTAKHNQSTENNSIGFYIVRNGDPTSGVILKNCLAVDNMSTTSDCFGFFYDETLKCSTIECNAFDNIATATTATVGSAGFYITSRSGNAGFGCKGCEWRYCTAVGNTGFDAAHSWGFNATSGAAGNENNAYIANLAYRNGPLGLAETTQQIATDDTQTGGVPINSVLPAVSGVTSIDYINTLTMGNPYINVRLADSLGL